jgi:hypothetical protein
MTTIVAATSPVPATLQDCTARIVSHDSGNPAIVSDLAKLLESISPLALSHRTADRRPTSTNPTKSQQIPFQTRTSRQAPPTQIQSSASSAKTRPASAELPRPTNPAKSRIHDLPRQTLLATTLSANSAKARCSLRNSLSSSHKSHQISRHGAAKACRASGSSRVCPDFLPSLPIPTMQPDLVSLAGHWEVCLIGHFPEIPRNPGLPHVQRPKGLPRIAAVSFAPSLLRNLASSRHSPQQSLCELCENAAPSV